MLNNTYKNHKTRSGVYIYIDVDNITFGDGWDFLKNIKTEIQGYMQINVAYFCLQRGQKGHSSPNRVN